MALWIVKYTALGLGTFLSTRLRASPPGLFAWRIARMLAIRLVNHIKGVLRFAPTAESKEALAAATAITLVISGLPDDAEETFTWEVTTD